MPHTTTRPDVAAWPVAPAASPQKIKWGAVFAGTVLGLALLATLSTLWFALAYGSELEDIRVNLEWYVGISAIACLFVGGLLAGWLSGVRGAAAGFFNGMTIWAMVSILTLGVGVPAVVSVLDARGLQAATETVATPTVAGAGSELWVTFWALLGSLLACALGGAIGGAVTRPANADLSTPPAPVAEPVRERVVAVDRDDDVEVVEPATTSHTRVS